MDRPRANSLEFRNTNEFFATRNSLQQPAQQRSSTAKLSPAQSILIPSPWGSLQFADREVEQEWRDYSRGASWQRVHPVLYSIIKLAALMLLVMAVVTIILFVSADSPENTLLRDDALRWTIVLAVHGGVCVGLIALFRGPAVKTVAASDQPAAPRASTAFANDPDGSVPQQQQEAAELDVSRKVNVAHATLAGWFALWLGTLAYLNIATKFARAADADASGDADARSAELHEHARASNNATAVIALLSLSCFMRGFRLAYEQCAFAGVLLLVSTLASWLVQPSEAPLGEQPAVSWTNLAWVLLAMLVDVAMVRAGERVRRRLFHAQRLMQVSHTRLMRENQMLMENSTSPGAAEPGSGEPFLDLESPVQKVLNMLRQMQLDDTLLLWQGAIEQAISKLSRAKLHDLFLPSAVRLASRRMGGAHGPDGVSGEPNETAMVQQILEEVEHHNDQDEVSDVPSSAAAGEPHKLKDGGVLVEERRKQILQQVTKKNLFSEKAQNVRTALKATSPTRGLLGVVAASQAAQPADVALDVASRATVSDTADVASSLAAAVDAAGDEPPVQPEESSPGGIRHLCDKRLQLLEESMPQWGCGEQSIFGLHEAFGPDLLFFILEHALRSFNLFEHFSIDALKLQQLASAIVAGYNDHPYHNYIHGCDVAHGTYWMLRQRLHMPGQGASRASAVNQRVSSQNGNGHRRGSASLHGQLVAQCIPEYAVLAGLLGAAIHDIGHDGYNNAFHVATGSPLAMKYNDKSCLENMHASLGLALLKEAKLDVLEGLSANQRKKFRTLVIDMIMGTDLANHFEQLSQIQTKTAEGAEGLTLSGEKCDLALFMGNVVHAADLGSTANAPPVYFDWMQRVFREFFHQGGREKELGLPVTPFMDRPNASIPKAQLGFLRYLCQPLFTAIEVVIPELSVATGHMTSNLAMLTELDEKKVGTEEIMSAGTLGDLLPAYAAPASDGAGEKLGPNEC